MKAASYEQLLPWLPWRCADQAGCCCSRERQRRPRAGALPLLKIPPLFLQEFSSSLATKLFIQGNVLPLSRLIMLHIRAYDVSITSSCAAYNLDTMQQPSSDSSSSRTLPLRTRHQIDDLVSWQKCSLPQHGTDHRTLTMALRVLFATFFFFRPLLPPLVLPIVVILPNGQSHIRVIVFLNACIFN